MRYRKNPAFALLDGHMEQVARAFGSKTGNELKELIYKAFEEQVAHKPFGHVIG